MVSQQVEAAVKETVQQDSVPQIQGVTAREKKVERDLYWVDWKVGQRELQAGFVFQLNELVMAVVATVGNATNQGAQP